MICLHYLVSSRTLSLWKFGLLGQTCLSCLSMPIMLVQSCLSMCNKWCLWPPGFISGTNQSMLKSRFSNYGNEINLFTIWGNNKLTLFFRSFAMNLKSPWYTEEFSRVILEFWFEEKSHRWQVKNDENNITIAML